MESFMVDGWMILGEEGKQKETVIYVIRGGCKILIGSNYQIVIVYRVQIH
jgi:hypothetical protein